jgi:hypothetical protein
LARNGYLMVVRYRLPANVDQAAVEAIAPRVTELAKFLDPAGS